MFEHLITSLDWKVLLGNGQTIDICKIHTYVHFEPRFKCAILVKNTISERSSRLFLFLNDRPVNILINVK